MSGTAASCDSMHDPHLREASWCDLPRDRENIAPVGPPIWRWPVPLTVPALQVTAYLGASERARHSQDALLVMEYPGRVILAVTDGATPTDETPTVGDVDGARHAARTVLEHLSAAPPSSALGRVFLTANEALLHRFGPASENGLHARDRPQAAAIAVALTLAADGATTEVETARAADCEVWVRRDGVWLLQSPRSMLKDGPRILLERWDVTHPDATYQDRIAEEKRILPDRSQWNLTALGRFERPKIDAPTVDHDFDELVLVTDGVDVARFPDGPPPDPRDWMVELRASEARGRPPRRRHSDVAMLHLRRQASIRQVNT